MDYVINNEKLMVEWDWERNNADGYDPHIITCGSGIKAHWICKDGHTWDARIYSRNKGYGCPKCGRILTAKKISVAKSGKSLQDLYPLIAKDWSYDKNCPLLPSDVNAHSDRRVWWTCQNGHEYQMSISKRTSRGNGCHYCSGHKILTGYNDLATKNPELLNEWDYEKNKDILPTQISVNSHTKVWWKCKDGHEWQSSIANRNRGNGCPQCGIISRVEKQMIPEDGRSLQELYPHIAAEWHPTKNDDVLPSQVSAYSNHYAWWRCDNGHEWRSKINNRSNGCNCPICDKGRKTSLPERTVYYYIKKYFDDAIWSYHGDELDGLELDIFIPSIRTAIEYDGGRWHIDSKKDMFKDELCTNLQISMIRIREKKCPIYESDCKFYYLNSRKRKELEDIIIDMLEGLGVKAPNVKIEADYANIQELLHHKKVKNSLAEKYPMVAKEWHPTKNGNIKPENVSYGSNQKVWWLCDKNHEWCGVVGHRAKGGKCPYCSNQKVLEGYNDLLTTNPTLASEWHPTKNGDLRPTQVMAGSNQKVWWLCSEGHEWIAMISSRNAGRGCRICGAKSSQRSKYKPVMCAELNRLFACVKDASHAIQIVDSAISGNCSGRIKSAGKHPTTGEELHWYYLYDQTRKDGTIIPGAITLGLIAEAEALAQLNTPQND